MNPPASELCALLDAIAFAAERHRTQRRKDVEASPYINHPIGLAYLLASEAGVDDVVALQAAVLHDTIEDTETTRDELAARFGEAVARVVDEVTDDKLLQKADRKRLQIEHAEHASPRAALVKLADKICNLRDLETRPPHGWSLHRRQEYFDWAKAVVDRLPPVSPTLRSLFDAAYAKRPARIPP